MTERNLEELLPWYANGTLEESERREVEAWLEDNPEAQLQLAEYEFLNETVSEVSEQEAVMRENLFDDLLERIESEEQQAANELQRDQAPTMMERLQNWFSETFQWGGTPQFAKVAVASQFALVMALGVFSWQQTGDLNTAQQTITELQEGYEVLSGSNPALVDAGIQMDIGLKPDLTIGQFQSLLKGHQAMIVSGPNSLGVYRIRLPEGSDMDQVHAALKASEGVIYLQRVEP